MNSLIAHTNMFQLIDLLSNALIIAVKDHNQFVSFYWYMILDFKLINYGKFDIINNADFISLNIQSCINKLGIVCVCLYVCARVCVRECVCVSVCEFYYILSRNLCSMRIQFMFLSISMLFCWYLAFLCSFLINVKFWLYTLLLIRIAI